METTGEDFLFFHSSFVENTSSLIIEVVVVKKENRKVEKASAGFAVVNIFDFPQQATAVVV